MIDVINRASLVLAEIEQRHSWHLSALRGELAGCVTELMRRREWQPGDRIRCTSPGVAGFTDHETYAFARRDGIHVVVAADDFGFSGHGLPAVCWEWVSRPSNPTAG